MAEIPDPGPRRRYGVKAFPPYRYIPGVHPHPTRDPAGHSYEPEPKLNRQPPWSSADWREIEPWLFGVDLFNARFFWEAHEAWEGLWAACERTSVPAIFLQGLIQIAAALLKAHMGSAAGVEVLAREGLEKLRRVAAAEPRLMGLDLPSTIADLEAFFAAGGVPDVARAPVLRLAEPTGDR